MGIDLILGQACPACNTGLDFAWLGRLHKYADSSLLSTSNVIQVEVEQVKKELIVAKVCEDPEMFEHWMDELVRLGKRQLLADIIENFEVEAHLS